MHTENRNSIRGATETVRISPLLLTLVVMYVSILVMSNILANHMLTFWKWTIDAGTLTFPLVYILSDVFSEVYGYKWSRRVTYYAAAMNLLLALLIRLVMVLPQPDWYDGNIFATAVGGSWRIVLASLVALNAGDFVNDLVFRVMKKNKPTKVVGFLARAAASSYLGGWVDTTAFVAIAFVGVIPAPELLPMIVLSVHLKFAYECLVLPITYKVATFVQRKEKRYESTDNWDQ